MTALTEPNLDEVIADEADTTAVTVARPTRAPVGRRVLAITTIALVTVAAFSLVFLAFEGPFGALWYSVRQDARSSDFHGAHEHTSRGHAIAIVQIPRIGLSTVVVEGDSADELRGGPGHRIGTPAPGAIGNPVILGHRSAWGGPFGRLEQLKPGDLIAVQVHAPDGTLPTAAYTVVSVKPAGADDLWPFAAATDHRLTLITTRGGHYSNDRLVVTAVSGTPGRAPAGTEVQNAATPPANTAARDATALAAIGLLGALAAWTALRRRHHRLTVTAIVAPFAIVAILGILLDIDLVLPALR